MTEFDYELHLKVFSLTIREKEKATVVPSIVGLLQSKQNMISLFEKDD